MKKTIREAIKEITELSEFEASLKTNSNHNSKEEIFINQESSSSKKNINIQLLQDDSVVNSDMIQTQQIKQPIVNDVNTIRSLGSRSPHALNFDQSFFYSDQKIPNKVQDEFTQLNSFIQDLNKKIAEIVVQNEADFLKIYKQQMTEIYKELMVLKRRVEDEDFNFKRNMKIQVLTEERNYFHKQAVFLDEKCRVLENENNELRFKNKIFKDDLTNYQDLIIDVKKENKQLKSELLFLYQNKSLFQENKIQQEKKELFIPSQQSIEKQFLKDIKRSSSQHSQNNQKEQIFNKTCLPQSLLVNSVKRSSSCKLLNLSQVNQNSVPSTPASTTNRSKMFKQKQNSQEIQAMKEIINQNSQYKQLLQQEHLQLQPQNKQEQKQAINKTTQNIQIVFQENQLIKNHTDLLKQSKKNLKLDLQISSKGMSALDLEQTRPESVKESKKDQIYKKQLSKLSNLFSKNINS